MSGLEVLAIAAGSIIKGLPALVVCLRHKTTASIQEKAEHDLNEALSIIYACKDFKDTELADLMDEYHERRAELTRQQEIRGAHNHFYINPSLNRLARALAEEIRDFYVLAVSTSTAARARTLTERCKQATVNSPIEVPFQMPPLGAQDAHNFKAAVEDALYRIGQQGAEFAESESKHDAPGDYLVISPLPSNYSQDSLLSLD